MHTFLNSKLMAKLLRQALAERAIEISHSDSLELVARQFGLANWNILAACIENAQRSEDAEVPRGWLKTGGAPRFYRVGSDPAEQAAWIESRPEAAATIRDGDFCTLMQTVDAAPYRGQRLRLSAELKAEHAETGATIWFRIDGPFGSLRFENLERYDKGGPVKGTVDWTERAIVLDVPNEATSLNYGFFLKGNGRCWARRFTLVEVDESVPLTTPEGYTLPRPTNLGFDEVA